MPSLDVIRQLTIKAQSEGVDKVAADLDKLATAQTKVATTAGGMATSTDSSSKSVLSAAKQFDTLNRSLDPVAKSQAVLDKGLRVVNNAFSQGVINSSEAAKAMAALQQRHIAVTQAVNDNAKALHGHSDAMGVNRMQMMEITHVARAVFDEIAAGQSPLRALQMEGGRIAQIFSSGTGGVGGTLKGIGNMLAPLATGWIGLGAAVGGAAALAGIAVLQFTNSQDKLAASLEGVGRRAGLTVAGLNAVAEAGAKAGRISDGAGRDLAGGFAKAGIGGDVSTSLIASSKAYGRVTDQSTGDAGAQLAAIFADPSKGLAELDKQLGMVDDRLQETVRNLEAQGRVEDARRVLSQALNSALAQTTDRTWTLSKAFDDAKGGIANFLSSLGRGIEHGVNAPSLEEQRASIQKAIEALSAPGLAAGAKLEDLPAGRGGYGAANRRALSGDLSPSDRASQMAALQSRLQSTNQAIADQERKAAEAKREADAQALSKQAGDVVRTILPEIMRGQNMANQIAVLKAAVSDPAVMGKLGVTSSQAMQAAGNLSVQQANSDPMQRMAEDHQLAMAAADAFSLAEKTAIEARRAELQVLRETGDVVKASAAAENKRSEAIAKANQDAKDNLEIAKENSKLVLLSPYERGRQEIKNQYEGYAGVLNKGAASPEAWKEAWKPIQTDFERAVVALEAIAGGKSAGTASFGSVGNASAPGNLMPIFAQASASSGVPANILAAMAKQESGFSNPANGQGIMQILSSTAKNPGYGVSPMDPSMRNDPTSNIMFGANYFAARAKSAGVSDWNDPSQVAKGLTAYNGGGDPNYAAHVMRYIGGSNDNSSTSAASDKQTEGIKLADYDKAQQQLPLLAGARDLQAQTEAFKALNAASADGAAKIAEVTKQQELFGSYTRAGIPVTDEMRTSVNELAAGFGRLASQQEAAKKLVETMDAVRSTARDGMGTFLNDLIAGKKGADALRDALRQVGSAIMNAGLNSLTSSLFGKSGSSGGGLFGSLFSSLFSKPIGANAGGTDDWSGGPTWVGEKGPEIVNLPAHAQVVPNSRASGSSQVIHMGDINIQGNVTEDVLPQIRQEMAAREARLRSSLQRDFGTMQSNFNKRYA